MAANEQIKAIVDKQTEYKTGVYKTLTEATAPVRYAPPAMLSDPAALNKAAKGILTGAIKPKTPSVTVATASAQASLLLRLGRDHQLANRSRLDMLADFVNEQASAAARATERYGI